jgi:ABC-type lipoprotein release transport system permease subunit
LANNVEVGEFLESGDLEGVVIGRKLARTLGVTVGDEMIAVVGAADGSIGNELWTVRGILKGMGEQIDRSAVMVSSAAFEQIFVSAGRIHEIALIGGAHRPANMAATGTYTDAYALEKALVGVVAAGDEVATWQVLVPTMAEMVAMTGQYNRLFGVIFFMAAGLGILNSMLMATYERIPEMGLMKALGTSPFRVFAEMTSEVAMLALLGAGAGMLLGSAGTLYLQNVGLDTSSFVGQIDVSGVVWDPVWRAEFGWGRVLGSTFAMVPVAILAALYPALVAARVQPVVALRRMS